MQVLTVQPAARRGVGVERCGTRDGSRPGSEPEYLRYLPG